MKRLLIASLIAFVAAVGLIAQVQISGGQTVVLASLAAPYTVGDIATADTTTTLQLVNDIATGNALLSGGVGTIPLWGKVALTTHVSGILPVANGGTANAFFTISGPAASAKTYTVPNVTSSLFATPTLAGTTTAPTIASGFGTGPSIVASNGTGAFTVDVGTGGIATAGVITMPAATTGWACHVINRTAVLGNVADAHTVQIATGTTSVTVENQTVSTGVVAVWTASDILQLMCIGY